MANQLRNFEIKKENADKIVFCKSVDANKCFEVSLK